jgi:hypothetical protein
MGSFVGAECAEPLTGRLTVLSKSRRIAFEARMIRRLNREAMRVGDWTTSGIAPQGEGRCAESGTPMGGDPTYRRDPTLQRSMNNLQSLYIHPLRLSRAGPKWRQDGQVLEVLTVNEIFVGGRLCQTLRSSVTWQKQALYGEVSKPTRIGHSIRHKLHKLVPDGNAKFAIVGIIAEGVICP